MNSLPFLIEIGQVYKMPIEIAEKEYKGRYHSLDPYNSTLFDAIYNSLIGNAHGEWYLEFGCKSRSIFIYHLFSLSRPVRVSPDRAYKFEQLPDKSYVSVTALINEQKYQAYDKSIGWVNNNLQSLCPKCHNTGWRNEVIPLEPEPCVISTEGFSKRALVEAMKRDQVVHTRCINEQCKCIFGAVGQHFNFVEAPTVMR